MNVGKALKKKSSKYKGVSWFAASSKWRAVIRVDGILRSLGLYLFEEDAARAYDIAAINHFGAFAHTNFQIAA